MNILTYYTTFYVNYKPSYVCYTFFWQPFLFFGRHFENRGLNFAAREKK